jgi:hypothetical protein
VLTAAVSPTAINMRRVATMMGVVDRAQDGPLELEHVAAGMAEAEAQSVSGTAVFVLACARPGAADAPARRPPVPARGVSVKVDLDTAVLHRRAQPGQGSDRPGKRD